jgi:hypothetical protein
VVVSLSAFDAGLARRASLRLPTPAPLESWDEVLPSPDAASASYGLSAPLLPPPPGTPDAVTLVQKLAAALGIVAPAGTLEERLKKRVAAIHASAHGRHVARESTGYAEQSPADAEAAWELLAQGGCWIDEAQPACGRARAVLPSAAALARWAEPAKAPEGIVLVAIATRGSAGETPVSPLMSKLYQESDLRPSAAVAALHPQTAQRLKLSSGRRVWVESAKGRVLAELRCDETLAPGRLALAAGPSPEVMHPGSSLAAQMQGALPLLEVASEDGTWRGTRVRVREA